MLQITSGATRRQPLWVVVRNSELPTQCPAYRPLSVLSPRTLLGNIWFACQGLAWVGVALQCVRFHVVSVLLLHIVPTASVCLPDRLPACLRSFPTLSSSSMRNEKHWVRCCMGAGEEGEHKMDRENGRERELTQCKMRVFDFLCSRSTPVNPNRCPIFRNAPILMADIKRHRKRSLKPCKCDRSRHLDYLEQIHLWHSACCCKMDTQKNINLVRPFDKHGSLLPMHGASKRETAKLGFNRRRADT